MSARSKQPTRRGNPPAAGAPGSASGEDDARTSVFDSGNFKREAATPIKAISMKTPADPKLAPVEKPARELPHVKLRAMSEMARSQQPQNLGNLAPPYDPSEARKRSARELVMWGCLAVMLASAIALVVWFVAT
jgi:hypothetical protein